VTASVSNARKGYRLTLWVSASSEAGLADVHGLLQLDGADPIPFCQLKGVQNPLARAWQEAFLAVAQVRAKPPKMSAAAPGPPGAPAPLPAGPVPLPPSAAAAPTSPPAAGAQPQAPASAPPSAAAPATNTAAPQAQPSLF
jgi:hypothetical protein